MKYTRIISQSLGLRCQLRNPNLTPSLINQWTFAANLGLSREFTSSPQGGPPSERVSAIVNELVNLTNLESADLTELLRKKSGIEEIPAIAIMMPGKGFSGLAGGAKAAKGGEETKKVEKTAFDLKLEGGFESGAKIKIIKEVRTFTALGLKEAKDLVEKSPTLLKKGVTKEEAETIIEKMKAIGAKVIME